MKEAASDSKSSVEAESIARAANNLESTTENLDGLISEAAVQLRMARTASMHFGGVIEPEILEATPLPDRAITIEILEHFRGHPYEDFLFWLRDTVKRKLGVKSADRFRWGLYAADAKNQAPGIAKQRAAAAKACEIANLARRLLPAE